MASPWELGLKRSAEAGAVTWRGHGPDSSYCTTVCFFTSPPFRLPPPYSPSSLTGILVPRTRGSHNGPRVPLAGDWIPSSIPFGPPSISRMCLSVGILPIYLQLSSDTVKHLPIAASPPCQGRTDERVYPLLRTTLYVFANSHQCPLGIALRSTDLDLQPRPR